MGTYYYLAASLPPLEFPSKPGVGFARLKSVLEMNLSPKDLQKVRDLCRFIDLLNIRLLLQEEALDSKGYLGEKDLDDALVDQVSFPQYVFEFLKEHKTLSEKLKYFPDLLATFFREMVMETSGFLQKFFSFEREWRLIVLAIRSKILHRDLAKELQFEDLADPLVRQILVQKEAEVYEPPAEYKEIKDLLHSCGPDPTEQNKALALYRFKKIGEMCEGEQFSIDWILAYLAQLMIVEYWDELDSVKGQMILDTFKTS
jgi:hypothetical protein